MSLSIITSSVSVLAARRCRVSASKFVALDTDKFGSINKEWLDFPETTPDL
jgi:hypothetical protein